ncbi:MAG: NAD(P)-dependent alcohol dehydrogenase [Pseudomonadota bacterium]
MRAWHQTSDNGIDGLELAEIPAGEPGPGEVKVRMRASSINYRDLSTIKDPLPRGIKFPFQPNSDGAGEVVAVGEGISSVKAGDRVASCFFQAWEDGPCSPEIMASALGGALPGVLAEEVILKEGGVIPVPEHFSFAEASTLPCAALTAWNAIVETGRTKAGDTVLLLGTGGVSIYALQFAAMLGARVIITSSSDDKLARAREMGAAETVNYRATPDWDQEVLKLTNGRGADVTVEVGGPGTLQKSIEATRVAGTIGLIGILAGGQINPLAIMRKSQRVQGIYVGSHRMFRDMNRAISLHQLKPVIHEEFAYDAAPDAYRAMEAAGHFGKLVVSI